MHIFMDAFQGSYKLKPYDMRHFSAFHLLLRFLLLLLVSYIRTMFFIPAAAFLMLMAAVVITSCQPYKISAHNKVDAINLMLLALFFLSYSASAYTFFLDRYWNDTANTLVDGSVIFIALYAVIILTFREITCLLKGIFRRLVSKFNRSKEDSAMLCNEQSGLLSYH